MASGVDLKAIGLAAKQIAGLGAQASGPALGAIAGEQLDPTSKAYLQNLQQDTRKMQQGKLGWTGAQKSQSVDAARRDIDASTRGLETEMRREAAASGGFGRSGAQQAAQEGIAGQKAAQVAQARVGAEALSQQQGQQAAAAIRLAAKERAEQMAVRGEKVGAVLGQGLGAMLGSPIAETVDVTGMRNAAIAAS